MKKTKKIAAIIMIMLASTSIADAKFWGSDDTDCIYISKGHYNDNGEELFQKQCKVFRFWIGFGYQNVGEEGPMGNG